MHHRLASVFQMGLHDNFIVIAGWSFVAAARVDHRNKQTVAAFHIAIRKSKLPHQFHTPDFKPDEVVGMIDHSHLIGLGIAHPYSRLADHWVMIFRRPHVPLQRGLRFSRKDETPSRKSAVVRMRALSSTAVAI